jgi:hypothetical protein
MDFPDKEGPILLDHEKKSGCKGRQPLAEYGRDRGLWRRLSSKKKLSFPHDPQRCTNLRH